MYNFHMDFYKNKKVLITGHTGFKGSWMCRALIGAGAKVTGYALKAPTQPSLFEMCDIESNMNSIEGDIRDLDHLKKVFAEAQPEIVIHMAAQPIVRDSYKNPVYTYETNVMGTVNICECVRNCQSVKSFVNVTTDKVYLNREWNWGYRENEELNGYDPYSNSKSCSELVTSCYRNSFFNEAEFDEDIDKGPDGKVHAQAKTCAISTARAGNVIGGGDFANDRIIPDCIRAMQNKEEIVVRNPYSTRPYEFVMEPVYAYLMIAAAQYEDKSFAGSYNVGPDDEDCINTGDLVTLFCDKWNARMCRRQGDGADANLGFDVNVVSGDNLKRNAGDGEDAELGYDVNVVSGDNLKRNAGDGEDAESDGGEVPSVREGRFLEASWKNVHDGGPHEANFLKLDHSKITTTFGWKPHWHIDKTMEAIIEWTDVWMNGGDIPAVMDKQIRDFIGF